MSTNTLEVTAMKDRSAAPQEPWSDAFDGSWDQLFQKIGAVEEILCRTSDGLWECELSVPVGSSRTVTLCPYTGEWGTSSPVSRPPMDLVRECLGLSESQSRELLTALAGAKEGQTDGWRRPSVRTVRQYAEIWGQDEGRLRSEFGLRDRVEGTSVWVEIPYRGRDGSVVATRRFGGVGVVPEMRMAPGIQQRYEKEILYGTDLAQGYDEPTLFVCDSEANLFSARLHGLQCIVLPDRDRPADALASLINGLEAVSQVIVIVAHEEDELGAAIARALHARGWQGEVRSVVPEPVVGTIDLARLNKLVGGDRDQFQGAVARLVAAACVETPPAEFKLTDCGNAKRFVRDHGDKVRYLFGRDAWHVWTGKQWCVDKTGRAVELAKRTATGIWQEAANAQDPDQRKRLGQWAATSEGGSRIMEMLRMARTEQGVAVELKELDADPYLLNVRNGTIDLRTGQLRPHRREDLLTKMCPVAYEPGATCPTWTGLLETVTAGNKDLQAYLQKAVGYSLSGDTSEECLFFLYGMGKNGKSTFSGTIAAILGDYFAKTSAESLMAKRQGGVSNDIARLAGPRFVVASEIDEGRRWSESLVKDFTGNDTITARFLYEEEFEFQPTFKIWAYGNHKPEVRGTDDGIWRRIRVIPFTVTIPEDKRLPRSELDAKLKAEWSGILNWAVQGCLLWQRERLGTPVEVSRATEEYKGENDVLGSFLESECERNPAVKVQSAVLYKKYTEWAEANGEYVWKNREFSKRLREKQLHGDKSTGGYWYWFGLQIRSTSGGPPPAKLLLHEDSEGAHVTSEELKGKVEALKQFASTTASGTRKAA